MKMQVYSKLPTDKHQIYFIDQRKAFDCTKPTHDLVEHPERISLLAHNFHLKSKKPHQVLWFLISMIFGICTGNTQGLQISLALSDRELAWPLPKLEDFKVDRVRVQEVECGSYTIAPVFRSLLHSMPCWKQYKKYLYPKDLAHLWRWCNAGQEYPWCLADFKRQLSI